MIFYISTIDSRYHITFQLATPSFDIKDFLEDDPCAIFEMENKNKNKLIIVKVDDFNKVNSIIIEISSNGVVLGVKAKCIIG